MNQINFVGAPIGNLEDISIRALRTILESDVVFAEDTRVYSKLKGLLIEKYKEIIVSLKIERVEQQVLSYREQNHDKAWMQILSAINEEKSIAIVSDAGMPAISDPGYLLLKAMHENNLEYDVIPGPTAFTSGLLLSGFPTDRFVFLGFPPRKKGKFKKLIEPYLKEEITIVLYESPFRVKKTLEILEDEYSDIQVSAVAEITKKFQNTHTGTPTELLKLLPEELKGEWVLVINKYK